jgi:hypothetical protein
MRTIGDIVMEMTERGGMPRRIQVRPGVPRGLGLTAGQVWQWSDQGAAYFCGQAPDTVLPAICVRRHWERFAVATARPAPRPRQLRLALNIGRPALCG